MNIYELKRWRNYFCSSLKDVWELALKSLLLKFLFPRMVLLVCLEYSSLRAGCSKTRSRRMCGVSSKNKDFNYMQEEKTESKGKTKVKYGVSLEDSKE